MPSSTANIVKVSDHVTAKLNAAHLLDIPVHRAMLEWLEIVKMRAKARAPKDTEGLADSLSVYVGVSAFPQAAGIKSNSRKFPFVHGIVTIPARPRHRSAPHWPPPNQSLTAWADRHGIPVFLVAKSISEKGTPIIPFVSEAVDESLPELDMALARAANAVGKVWIA